MSVYIHNSNTGDKVAHFRPFGETVNLLYIVLGIPDHVKYSPDFKSRELALNYGIFVYELDGNNQVIRGFKDE
jgi:hypothetical protein